MLQIAGRRSIVIARRLHIVYGDRWCSGTSTFSNETQKLVAAKDTQPGRLAGAIAKQIRETGAAYVVAMGPTAVYKAVHSAAVAGTYLAPEEPEKDLNFTVDRNSRNSELASGRNTEDSQVELCFGVRLLPKVQETPAIRGNYSSGKDVDVRISNATNVGKVAAFIAKLLAEENAVPVLRSMGATSCSQALKAAVIARKYLADGPGGLAVGEDLVFAPRMLKTFADGQRRSEMVLRCRRVFPASSSKSHP